MALPNKYKADMTVLPSNCDFECRLGLYDTFRIFMDIANTHAGILGVGQSTLMDRNQYWLTVKTRIRFFRRPLMNASMQIETWPVRPGSLRSDRCYRLLDAEGPIAEGRTEWAVMDLNRGRLSNIKDIFPSELIFNEEDISVVDYPRIVACDDTYTEKGSYRVSSSDIDMGHHMNNTAYVRALLGIYSEQELREMDIQEMTMIYKTSAHEGDMLVLKEKRTDNIIEAGLYFPDGKPSVLAQIVCKG